MPNGGDCPYRGMQTVSKYLAREIPECERDLKRLMLQLSIDRDYVESPEAEPREVEYFRLQVQLEQMEVDYLQRKLGLLKSWAAR